MVRNRRSEVATGPIAGPVVVFFEFNLDPPQAPYLHIPRAAHLGAVLLPLCAVGDLLGEVA
jgi:hypothetical protein